MQQGSVKILYHSENADSMVAAAGRISTTKGSADEVYEKSCEKSQDANISLIRKIMSSGHTSVLEHAFFNLSFQNVSVFVEQFMIEFRLASFTVKSRRYVDFGNMGFVMPELEKYGEKADAIREIYQQHMEYLFREYNAFCEEGIPREDARFVLPYSFRSNFYCTVNARELIRIVNEMIWGRGREYPEIVRLGNMLMEQCRSEMPFLNMGEALSGINDSTEQQPAYSTGDLEDTSGGAAFERMLFAGENEGRTNIDDGESKQQQVMLLNVPEHPEEVICRAAMLAEGLNGQWPDLKDPDVQRKIIGNILSRSRKRELEQVSFTVLFRRVSLAGVTHFVRHRMQSIIVPKYINVCDFDQYVMPESIVAAGLTERYERIFRESRRAAKELKTRGLEKCDGIYLLLSGLTVPIMTTMNANELFLFIRLRSCNRAQWEIAEHTRTLLGLLRDRYPVLFSMYGPGCYVTGRCPEGRMTCGQIEKVRASFAMKT